MLVPPGMGGVWWAHATYPGGEEHFTPNVRVSPPLFVLSLYGCNYHIYVGANVVSLRRDCVGPPILAQG